MLAPHGKTSMVLDGVHAHFWPDNYSLHELLLKEDDVESLLLDVDHRYVCNTIF